MLKQVIDTHLEYKNGVFYWKKPTSNRVKIGDIFGSLQNTGYIGGRLDGAFYLVHRLVYEYFNGPIPKDSFIDHIDRNRLNNKIENLRCVTKQQNTFNCLNTKGYIKYKDKYIARITLNHKQYQIGTYSTPEEATKAYETVKPILHTFCNTSVSEQEIKQKILEVRPKTQSNNTSGVKGVHKRPNGTYQARYRKDGKYISLGHYKTIEEAEKAYKLHEQCARLF